MLHTFFLRCRALLIAGIAMLLLLQPHQAQAADYTANADLTNGVATLWFKSTQNVMWVDAHYNVNGGAQQNLRMAYSNVNARFETSFPASAGQTVNFAFTYNVNGLAYDTAAGAVTLGGGGGGGTASAPTFSPGAGSYTTAQSVALASTTPGATLRYTTDGSMPTASSPVYAGPVNIPASTTLKAYASASGMSDSPVGSAAYTIGGGGGNGFTHGVSAAGSNATLWFAPAPSTSIAWVDAHYTATAGQQNVRMVYNTAQSRFEATITPAPAGTTVTYSFTYFVNGTGAHDSAVYTQVVGGDSNGGTVVTPVMSPGGGSFSTAQSVTLSSATAGATIRYTTDGSAPTASSAIYGGAIAVPSTGTIKAVASKSGMTDSAVGSATYTITVQPPAFVQGVAELGATATVWFKPSAAMNFVILHYQIGTASQINPLMAYNPTLGRFETVLSPLNRGSVIGYSFTYQPAGGAQTDSPAYTYAVGADNGIASPTFAPAAGNYATTQSVVLTTTVSGGVIRYTTDGSAPNALSSRYTAPIAVATATTINAMVIAPNGSESRLASATYVIGTVSGKVAMPLLSHATGSYNTAIHVNLLSSTPGATLRFTTDGSTPTVNSPAYAGTIALTASTTLKAVGFKAGMTPSDVATASYAITPGVSAPWNGMTTFNIVNGTHGKFTDSQIYWSIIGKDWNTGNFVHVDSSGHLVPMSLGDNGALMKNGLPYSNYFYTLDQLRSVTIPAINSARLLMSVGSPMFIWVNSDINGRIGYAGANIENPNDPNTDVVFDFGEFAILPVGASPQGIFINTTRVDQFGFPLQLTVTGLNGFVQTVGESLSESRSELFAKFINETAPAFQGLALAPYAPARIMAPAHATFQDGGPNANYLDAYITQVWNQYTTQDLVIDLHNGWAPFTGRVVGGKMRFTDTAGGVYYINGKPSTAEVMLGRGLLDDRTGGTTNGDKQLQLQAQLCAALNRQVAHLPFASWWNGSAFYTPGQPANDFARFWHAHSLNALAYGFAYDDVGNFSPSIHTETPVSVTYTIGW